MKNTAKSVVEKMFAAFGIADIEKFMQTVSEDTVWILNFQPLEYIVDGNKIVVLGQEHQRVRKSGKELKQQWQVYTVENDWITRMEEFATSEVVAQAA